jgi:deoxyribodipyrimidine photo-lyase
MARGRSVRVERATTVPAVPFGRVFDANDAPVRAAGRFVLYWMIGARRTGWSFGLQRAVERSRELDRPLLVLEPLRAGYPFASDRLHRFVLDGMHDNAARFRAAGVAYHPYVEPSPGAGRGLLERLAADACLVVTDDVPFFFLPRMVRAAAGRLPVRLERVDGNGLLPLRRADRAYPTAHSFRALLQRQLPAQLAEFPLPDPLAVERPARRAPLPAEVRRRWPAADPALLAGRRGLDHLPLDHAVPPSPFRGGAVAGHAALHAFLERLDDYARDRNHPDRDATSNLSPYLHFGHLAPHEVFAAAMTREGWHDGQLGRPAGGARTGWWGVGPSLEAFLDQLVTWRELGLNRCLFDEAAARWESLPAWARATLAAHARDRRPQLYDPDALEQARTHDRLWNAAQTQLVREGRLHNYLRMLWGKKLLEWSPTPQDALATMLRLNDRWALDGRDANSISGITWVLGRYDRPWGPERPVFGTVRYMSSENTARKLRLREYLARYAP